MPAGGGEDTSTFTCQDFCFLWSHSLFICWPFPSQTYFGTFASAANSNKTKWPADASATQEQSQWLQLNREVIRIFENPPIDQPLGPFAKRSFPDNYNRPVLSQEFCFGWAENELFDLDAFGCTYLDFIGKKKHYKAK